MSQELVCSTYEWRGRTGPLTLMLPPGVFTPTHTTLVMGDALEINPGDVVLDVGCGSGVLGFVAARLGAARIIGCDVSAAAVDSAGENARRLGLSDRSEYHRGHLFEPVTNVEADVVIGDVSGIPDAIAEVTPWTSGGPTGAELPSEMLETLGQRLKIGGRLYLPTGTMQAEAPLLEVARNLFGDDNMHPLAVREYPLPPTVARSPAVQRLVDDGTLDMRPRGTRLMWRLTVWRCTRT
ncbi:MAG TPA: 50S ribosomal protein L11 methyltransferase [Acidimicrobiia bacterium]|nr:50S ribosomal protein L11 methyltransferase [Acidimicrobiia bacterium]